MPQRQRICLLMQETWVRSLGWENLLEKEVAPLSNILAWKSHEQRSLGDYCLWVHKESDMTKQL